MFAKLCISILLLALATCSSKNDHDASADYEEAMKESQTATAAETPHPISTDKFEIKTLKVGKGRAIKSGETAVVQYTGWLKDGTKFDSSLDRHEPLKFRLGAGQVIEGWDKGVDGMKVGEKRKITIPPELGYGDHGSGPIPPNSTLIFDIELVGINK